MKIAVVSYSMTGNNARFAAQLAKSLSAAHLSLKTKKPVTSGSIALDLMFQRKPEIELSRDAFASYDLVLFVAPVWMGQVAFPLRRCLDALKANSRPYGFLSISGGALGDNPNLARELTRRAGTKPAFVLDQHIVSLLPSDPPPTSKDTAAYQLSEADCNSLTAKALEQIRAQFSSDL